MHKNIRLLVLASKNVKELTGAPVNREGSFYPLHTFRGANCPVNQDLFGALLTCLILST
jgi:hypothetical protein